MTNCKLCYKQKSDHSEKLWVLHTQALVCSFCHKNSNEHSEKLWEMHKRAIENGLHCPLHKKKEKLYPITVGFGRKGVARTCKINAEPPYNIDFVPIYMSCTECSLFLGSDEEDYADILDGMCFVCFKKLTGQFEVN